VTEKTLIAGTASHTENMIPPQPPPCICSQCKCLHTTDYS